MFQALFSSKDESKKLKCRLLQFLFAALRVKAFVTYSPFPVELQETIKQTNKQKLNYLARKCLQIRFNSPVSQFFL